MRKVPVLSTGNVIFYLEDYKGLTFIHCDVLSKWTKKVKKELEQGFKEVTETHQPPFYALHTKTDIKHEKFLKMLDFKYLKTTMGLDNNEYEIYVWR